MRFTATAAIFFLGATAMASPTRRGNENVSVSDFSIHKEANVVDSYSFKLTGDEASGLQCSGQGGVPSEVVTCGDSKYRFAVNAGADSSTFNLRIYHELGTAVGFNGAADIATYCRSGGLDTMVCFGVVDTTVINIEG